MTKKRAFLSLIAIVLVLLVSGCIEGSKETATATVPAEAAVTEAPPATDIPLPTNTPEPNTIILYAPTDAPAAQVNKAQTLLSTLAGQQGMVLDVKMQLTDQDVTDACAVLVLLSENGVDAATLANQHPAMKVIVLREAAVEGQPANVISLISDSTLLEFAAGYVSTLVAPDWRAAGLLPWDDENSGSETQDAFDNGASYYCGRCNSTYMPVTSFPVTRSLASNSAPESWINAVVDLHNQYYIYTVFVSKEAASTELYQHLQTMNVTVIGEEKPEGIENLLWAATIQQEPLTVIEAQWENILNGTLESNEIVVPVVLMDVNEEYLSSGRIRLYEEMMENLTGGWILPLSPVYP